MAALSISEPLSPAVRRGLLAGVIVLHAGIGWALTQVQPTKLIVGDIAPMQVSFVEADRPQAPQESPAQPEPPQTDPAPPLESMIQPPAPDLPPPVFPVPAPKPTSPPAKAKPAVPNPPTQAAPPTSAPHGQAAVAGPRTVTDAQVGYLDRPSPIYPSRSRRANEQGTVLVRVLVDTGGRPTQVSIQQSSGHPALDESALSALRAARFRPFIDGGIAQAVWVIAPIKFSMQ
jgi:periplasmic protein TonB